eukprot:5166063-Pleurochrysis_carterae.AAC.2
MLRSWEPAPAMPPIEFVGDLKQMRSTAPPAQEVLDAWRAQLGLAPAQSRSPSPREALASEVSVPLQFARRSRVVKEVRPCSQHRRHRRDGKLQTAKTLTKSARYVPRLPLLKSTRAQGSCRRGMRPPFVGSPPQRRPNEVNNARRIWLAASTHPGEEEQVLQVRGLDVRRLRCCG